MNNKYFEGKYFIVRCDRASVFAGEIVEQNGQEVVMKNARRIWSWSGAATLSQMAIDGVKYPDRCKFSMPVDEIVLLDAIEIIPCTEKAENCIKGVSVWKI